MGEELKHVTLTLCVYRDILYHTNSVGCNVSEEVLKKSRSLLSSKCQNMVSGTFSAYSYFGERKPSLVS